MRAGWSAALAGYHLLPSVRGDLLVRLGRGEEARAEFELAASLTENERVRVQLLARASESGARVGAGAAQSSASG